MVVVHSLQHLADHAADLKVPEHTVWWWHLAALAEHGQHRCNEQVACVMVAHIAQLVHGMHGVSCRVGATPSSRADTPLCCVKPQRQTLEALLGGPDT